MKVAEKKTLLKTRRSHTDAKRTRRWIFRVILRLAVCGSFVMFLLLMVDTYYPKDLRRHLMRRTFWSNAFVSWETSSPEMHGLSVSQFDRLADHLKTRRTKSFLVAQQGKIVYEWYAQGRGPESVHGTASLAKSLVGSLSLLLALQDGKVALDDPACKYIPAWRDDPQRSKITLRHLATHSSGIEDATGEMADWKSSYWRDRPKRFRISIDDAPMVFDPGDRLAYSNPGVSALAYVITQAIRENRHRDILNLLEKRIMQPLNLPLAAWSISYGESYWVDGMRVYVIGGGGRYTPRAVARIGQLMLEKGAWNGKQVIDANWIDQATTFAGGKSLKMPEGFPAPGLLWWSNSNGVWENVPRDAFLGAGHGHQILLVIPSMELVVVRFGGPLVKGLPKEVVRMDWDSLEEHLLNPLMECVRPKKSQQDYSVN